MLLKQGTTLTPRVQEDGSIRTGFAIILSTEPTHPDIISWYQVSSDNAFCIETLGTSYHIMTDFGNIFKMTYMEVLSSYTIGKVDDIEERFKRQKELLLEAEFLIKGYY
jgi:hypothetical protein